MRIFRCDRCGHAVPFSAQRCGECDASLGYVTEDRTIRVLSESSDAAVFRIDERRVWRCLNAAWRCNWVVPADSDNPWCRSCQLTRGRPDEARHDAIEAWMAAEEAKRRLVHQLDELSLPIEAKSAAAADGLAFDLVYLPGEPQITGHLDGVVTLDLAEIDDRHREDLRKLLGEPFRTVIGHLRHEIGHHYWKRLVGQSNDIARFRELFGDETADYRSAIDQFYASAVEEWDHRRFVSPYAAAHPLEDWAETFAHYLHIVDAIDTAAAYELLPRAPAEPCEASPRVRFEATLDAWRPINRAVNAVAESLGAAAVYPFEPVGIVVDKLAFVHQQVAAHTRRDRFYAAD